MIWRWHSIAIGLLAISLIYPLDSRAQTRDAVVPGPAFDVASIKRRPNFDPQVRSDIRFDPGTLTAIQVTMTPVIYKAYGIQSFQLSGLPGWGDSEFYDIIARANTPADQAQILRMLQTLLADRFKLKAHWESRELPSYAMVVGSKGAKVQKSTETEQPETILISGTRFSGKKVSMAEVAARLSGALRRSVIDRTGLMGNFDFDARWKADSSLTYGSPEFWDAFLSEVRDQIGLRMESQKSPVEILVIDSIERPSEN